MERVQIQFTDKAKAAAQTLAEDGKGLRFAVSRSGCCSVSVALYPDTERVTDDVIEVDGIRILKKKDEYSGLSWNGTIDYKEKGLNKGFHWR